MRFARLERRHGSFSSRVGRARTRIVARAARAEG
jgi:hypothetical protein